MWLQERVRAFGRRKDEGHEEVEEEGGERGEEEGRWPNPDPNLWLGRGI